MLISRRTLLGGLGSVAAGAWFITSCKPTPRRPQGNATPTPSGDPQSAVALAPADGEIIADGVQSNFAGNGFYTRNGFARARDWVGPKPGGGNYAGFDDVNFLPIAIWLCDFGGTSFYSRMDDLGINGMLPAAGSISLANNITFGKWAVVTDDAVPGGTISSSDDPGVIGVSTGEEPGTVIQYDTIVNNAATWQASSDGAGRLHLFNFADNILNGDVAGTYFPGDMVAAGDFTACDQYWFAGAADAAPVSQTKVHFRLYAPTSGSATQTQCARGSHYGSMMDSIRKNYEDTWADCMLD